MFGWNKAKEITRSWLQLELGKSLFVPVGLGLWLLPTLVLLVEVGYVLGIGDHRNVGCRYGLIEHWYPLDLLEPLVFLNVSIATDQIAKPARDVLHQIHKVNRLHLPFR